MEDMRQERRSAPTSFRFFSLTSAVDPAAPEADDILQPVVSQTSWIRNETLLAVQLSLGNKLTI